MSSWKQRCLLGNHTDDVMSGGSSQHQMGGVYHVYIPDFIRLVSRHLQGKKLIFKHFCSLDVLIFAQRSTHPSLQRCEKVKNCVHVAFDPSLEDRFLWHLMEKADLYKLPCYTVAFTQHRHLIFIMCPWWGHDNLWQPCVCCTADWRQKRPPSCCLSQHIWLLHSTRDVE